jgi:hypothetical protein
MAKKNSCDSFQKNKIKKKENNLENITVQKRFSSCVGRGKGKG